MESVAVEKDSKIVSPSKSATTGRAKRKHPLFTFEEESDHDSSDDYLDNHEEANAGCTIKISSEEEGDPHTSSPSIQYEIPDPHHRRLDIRWAQCFYKSTEPVVGRRYMAKCIYCETEFQGRPAALERHVRHQCAQISTKHRLRYLAVIGGGSGSGGVSSSGPPALSSQSSPSVKEGQEETTTAVRKTKRSRVSLSLRKKAEDSQDVRNADAQIALNSSKIVPEILNNTFPLNRSLQDIVEAFERQKTNLLHEVTDMPAISLSLQNWRVSLQSFFSPSPSSSSSSSSSSASSPCVHVYALWGSHSLLDVLFFSEGTHSCSTVQKEIEQSFQEFNVLGGDLLSSQETPVSLVLRDRENSTLCTVSEWLQDMNSCFLSMPCGSSRLHSLFAFICNIPPFHEVLKRNYCFVQHLLRSTQWREALYTYQCQANERAIEKMKAKRNVNKTNNKNDDGGSQRAKSTELFYKELFSLSQHSPTSLHAICEFTQHHFPAFCALCSDTAACSSLPALDADMQALLKNVHHLNSNRVFLAVIAPVVTAMDTLSSDPSPSLTTVVETLLRVCREMELAHVAGAAWGPAHMKALNALKTIITEFASEDVLNVALFLDPRTTHLAYTSSLTDTGNIDLPGSHTLPVTYHITRRDKSYFVGKLRSLALVFFSSLELDEYDFDRLEREIEDFIGKEGLFSEFHGMFCAEQGKTMSSKELWETFRDSQALLQHGCEYLDEIALKLLSVPAFVPAKYTHAVKELVDSFASRFVDVQPLSLLRSQSLQAKELFFQLQVKLSLLNEELFPSKKRANNKAPTPPPSSSSNVEDHHDNVFLAGDISLWLAQHFETIKATPPIDVQETKDQRKVLLQLSK